MNWAFVPHLILEEIFLHLSYHDRFNASLVCAELILFNFYLKKKNTFCDDLQVCRHWSHCFQSSKLWQRLIIDDRWFNKIVNIQTDDEIPMPNPILDYNRATNYLNCVGHHIRMVFIQSISNFDLLFQSLSLLHWFLEQKVFQLNIFFFFQTFII